MNVSSISNWLGRLKARQVPAGSWAEQRRNEALELIASARDGDTWITLSHHDNGFVREVAVRALCAEQMPQALQAGWLQEISGWCDRQYRIIDPATSPTARAVLVARLQGLATTGLVRAQQVARVIA